MSEQGTIERGDISTEDAEKLAAAAERMAIDRPAPVEDQLAMLRAAGLVDVDCLFRSWRFAVLAGWAPLT